MSLQILDTQIVSHAFRGTGEVLDPLRQVVPSTAACEFLELFTPNPTRARYYLPLLSSPRHTDVAFSRLQVRDHPFQRLHTDRHLYDLGSEHGAWMDYGNMAMAAAINTRNAAVFGAAIAHLDKTQRKRIKAGFDFLLDARIECMPMSLSASDLVPQLFARLVRRTQPKEDRRNTLSDVMILAAAKDAGGILRTRDGVLRDFAQEVMEAAWQAESAAFLLDFRARDCADRRVAHESKGYINQPWLHRKRHPVLPT